jgi:hypothetical protein
MRRLFLFALPALLSAGVLAPLTAQDNTKADVQGVVVDRASGAPIVAASVTIVGRRTSFLTDREGRFRFKGVPTGQVTIEVEQLGYADFSETRTIEANGAPLRLQLEPDPIVLKGVQVIADRMKVRRSAVATSVRAYTAEQLAMSASFDAYDFVRSRLWIMPCDARYAAAAFTSSCIMRRGSITAPTVYIDEARHIGGLDDLMGWPMDDIYLVEVYSSGAQVRVYTKRFAERLAKGRGFLDPVIW